MGESRTDFNVDAVRELMRLRDVGFGNADDAMKETGMLLRDMYNAVVDPVTVNREML